jgi:hypothetical protein
VEILTAVMSEITDKIKQRTVSLERPLHTRGLDCLLNSIRNTEVELAKNSSSLQIRRLDIARRREELEGRKKVVGWAKTCPLPTLSSVAKQCTLRSTSTHSDLQLVCRELSQRRAVLAREIVDLYPIESQGKIRSLRGFGIPSVNALKRISSQVVQDEESLSTALGYLLHRMVLIACILDAPLKYVLVPTGSKSTIVDSFSTLTPPGNTYPLYVKVRFTSVSAVMFHIGRSDRSETFPLGAADAAGYFGPCMSFVYMIVLIFV